MNPAVVLLARAPSAKGKTRLTAHVPETRARELRTALLLDTLDVARAANLPLFVSYTPDDAHAEMTALAPDARLIAQRGSDLGERMRHAIDDVLTLGADVVVLIGSDLPTLPADYLGAAIDLLNSGAHVVLGPSDDGGFYLIASRTTLPPIFEGVEWSSAAVRDRVIGNAHARGLSVAVLPSWSDVDAAEDLQRALADPRPHAARHLRALFGGG